MISLTRLEQYVGDDREARYQVRGRLTRRCAPVDIDMGQVPAGGAWWSIPLPPCPDCGGALEWAEAGNVPGARECAACGSLFMVEGRPDHGGPAPSPPPASAPLQAANCGCGHLCVDQDCKAPDLDDCGCECEPCRRHTAERTSRWKAERLAAQTRCGEILDDLSQCPAEGCSVSLPTPAGRGTARAGPYCGAHGGEARARAEAERDWRILAPESVGGDADVTRAGCLGLDSTDAVVVVRPEREHWLAWLGIGSHMLPVRHGGMTARDRRRVERGFRPHGRPSCSYPTQEAATSAAVAAWKEHLAADIAEITAARGGTLEWGVSVQPASAPRIIVLGEHGSAWDAYSG